MLMLAEEGSWDSSSDVPDGGRLHTGQRREPLDELIVERRHPGGLAVLGARKLQTQGQNAGRRKSRVSVVQRDEAADQQTRADEQHQRDRKLAHGERRAQPPSPDTLGPASAAFFQMHAGIAARRVQRREDADENAADQRCGGGVREHLRVDGDVGQARQRSRRKRSQQVHAPGGEHQSRGAAKQRDDQALGEQLAQQPRTAGAERGANRQLAVARRRARQQQVRDIRARDEQDERDGAEQDEERPAHFANQFHVQRHEPDPDPAVRWILLLQPRRDHVHLRLGGRLPDARLQTSDHGQPERSPRLEQLLELPHRRERHPQLGIGRMAERGRHHAGDFIRQPVEHDLPSDDCTDPRRNGASRFRARG